MGDSEPKFNLNVLQIASPCSEKWDDMEGDERTRYCQACKLNVYNLRDMTRDEAEKLVIENEGHLCVRMFRRKDGTVITKDCPVGIALKQRLGLMMLAGSAFIVMAVFWMRGDKLQCYRAADSMFVSLKNAITGIFETPDAVAGGIMAP